MLVSASQLGTGAFSLVITMANKINMTKYPWMPFYAKDFVSATVEMTNEEVGAYIRMLSYQWINGSLNSTPNRLPIGILNAESLAIVLAKFEKCADGKLRNLRLETIRTEFLEVRMAKSEGGKKGAAKRWDKTPNGLPTSTPNANHNQSHIHSQNKSNTKSKTATKVTYADKVREYFEYTITIEKIHEWEEAFTDVDVDKEIRSAKMWLLDHPKQQKKNFDSFMGGWLRRTEPVKKEVSITAVGKKLARELGI